MAAQQSPGGPVRSGRAGRPFPPACLARVGLCLGLGLGSGGWQAAAAQTPAGPAQPGATGVAAADHWHAAERQARASPALGALFKRACARAVAPANLALALQHLQQAEAAHQRERELPRPQPGPLLQAVVARGCAAYHATRLQPGVSYPVWWHSQLQIDGVRPAASGFEIQASARNAAGAVAPGRVTFSRGLHHACFVATGAQGQAACALVDTHPHGSRVNGWAEAHEGPFVATFAGSVTPTRVELPAVEFRDLPVFARAPMLR